MATSSTTTAKKKSTTTKKKTTPKPATSAVTEEAKEKVKESKRAFKNNDGIVCRSITQGGLYMEGQKTHALYEWVTYGDETEVEYQDLVSAVRTKSNFVFAPLFIVEDDDFVNEFPALKKFYDENYTVKELEKIIKYPLNEMLEAISTLPHSAKESLKAIAGTAVVEGKLDSVKKINALDELFGTKMSLLAEFTE